MALFAIGNMMLKVKRKKLPRPETANWIAIILALIAVFVALAGNILKTPDEGMPNNFLIFSEYFLFAFSLILVMLNRVALLKLILGFVQNIFSTVLLILRRINRSILNTIDRINSQEFVFFTKGDNIANLNRVMLYIRKNEHTKKIKIVTVLEKEEPELVEKLTIDLVFLDREYPEIEIEFIHIEGEEFGPQLVKELSKEWNIPINFMFIGSPGMHFPYRLEELGGVRLII